MNDFVSGRGSVPNTSRVTIHAVPIPFQDLERKRTEPTLAETERAENEAKVETKKKSSHKRHGNVPYRKSVPNAPHDPFRIGARSVSEYETDQRMTRIHHEVKRIQAEMKLIRDAFETISEPNRKMRRKYAAIMRQLQHAIDTMPSQ